eukprot:CAMPEP_0182925368 /NCGR_PEP_ID=MMETSP0105_2-20130417/9376_1 /TAXON_ID=81532 ORGANISM="Acanthoeca-like sp., Strain 10tr" /NCGR_SAMPLE_ID=MMETSP0105_2 /ASSEMBLY_ACC=CAM_ASM_000205 /LENGTH=201 /DNA_ID=CAMNT_0025063215 /DNA_START=41 /DNA_END=646 /DNA_ORIENTATION=-
MPLLVLSAEHKAHLRLLAEVDEEAVLEFGRLALDFVLKGTNTKVYSAAGKKLGVSAADVRNGVQGLMFLFTESSKLRMTQMDFNDTVMILGFPQGLHSLLLALFNEHCETIRRVAGHMTMSLPTYKDLKWRIDAQIASRTLRQSVEPTVVLQIDTLDENSDAASITLQTDPTTLAHMTAQLEAALKAVKMSHYRRITRAIK